MSRRCFVAVCSIAVAACGHGAGPLVHRVRDQVEPLWRLHVPGGFAKTYAELLKGETVVANYKLPVRLRANADPWGAMAELEQMGRDAAGRPPASRPTSENILRGMNSALRRTAREWWVDARLEDRKGLPQQIAALKELLKESESYRRRAVSHLTPEQQKELRARAGKIVKEFGPQEELNPSTEPALAADREFVRAAWSKVDWDDLLVCAALSADFTLKAGSPADTSPFLTRLVQNGAKARLRRSRVPGVVGQVVFEEKLPEGWLIIGGPGPNTYEIREPVAVLIDLGGDDTYRGRVGSSSGPAGGNSLVVDVSGNDTYDCGDLGLATGVLGCGMVVDMRGNDTYRMGDGAGGVGLAGIGVLDDRAGNDRYIASRYGLGSAIGGLGLLFDAKGSDRYECEIYGIGLGGPAGVGAVVDLEGADTYRCGFAVPSGYNAMDGASKKTDPNFQYEGWGMGMGLGRRLYPSTAEGSAKYALAGGLGMLIDVKGDDAYESSNFSVGCGYFFGVGLCLDAEGNDRYTAARYGLASGAHFAMGLMIDAAGNDVYGSTGPTYDCGCSWDHSAFLFIDGGGNDLYDLKHSAGPARADIGSWGVAADLAGNDVYRLTGYPASNSRDGLGAFLDLSGVDTYDFPVGAPGAPGDGKTLVLPPGGVFCDR